MDPLSIAAAVFGLVGAIEQILPPICQYATGVRDANREIDQLCSELFALKGALEHVRMTALNLASKESDGDDRSWTPFLKATEFGEMIVATEALLADLSRRLNKAPGRLNSKLRSLKWPFKKDDMKDEIMRLERLKSFFILVTTTDNLDICRQMYAEFRSFTRAFNDQKEQHDNKVECTVSGILNIQCQGTADRLTAKLHKSIIQWLAPYDPEPLYQKALAADQVRTGRWFLGGPFKQWLTRESAPVLWLRGKPGIGKTTLLSAAIREASALESTTQSFASVYFFCSFTDMSSQDPVNLFGSLVVQLCTLYPRFWAKIEDRYHEEVDKGVRHLHRLRLDDLEKILVSILTSLPKVLIFVDALNESKQSAVSLAFLRGLITEVDSLQIMLSSTEELALPSEYVGSMVSPVSMEPKDVKNDIADYVESWLESNERLKYLDADLKASIRSRLFRRSDGMFRWVQCQLESLVLQKTPRAMKATLDQVPATLEQTYNILLKRIPKEDRYLAKQAFLWLVFSTRPLSLEELCEAAIVDEHYLGVNKEARLLRPADLLEICSSLIARDSNEQDIVLAHSSVLTYLTSQQIKDSDVSEFYINPDSADNILTCKCLSYLCSPALQTGYCDSAEELSHREEVWPLLSYCVYSWKHHARDLDSWPVIPELTHKLILQFFRSAQSSRGGNFGAWVQAYFPFASLDIESSTPLYYASRFGLNNIVKTILHLEGPGSLEIRGGRRGSTPLHVASAVGTLKVVETLLIAGADAKEVNEMGEGGLQWAVIRGDVNIVERLLAAGADPSFRDRRGYTPLFYSIRYQREKCRTALLKAGADPLDIDGKGLNINLQLLAKYNIDLCLYE